MIIWWKWKPKLNVMRFSESIIADGQGGFDTVIFEGSTGDDLFSFEGTPRIKDEFRAAVSAAGEWAGEVDVANAGAWLLVILIFNFARSFPPAIFFISF